MAKKLTIIDIANLAGVGKSTVSRVLNNDPNVKAATREKVQAVIAEHAFEPSKSAQAMRGGKTKLVGVIIANLSSNSENSAVGGILETLYGQGFDVAVMESRFDDSKVAEHLAVLKKRDAEGVILFGFSGCNYDNLKSFRQKAVVMAVTHPDYHSVSYDNQGAISQLLDHLYGIGHRHIAYLGVDASDKTTGEERQVAYLAFCQAHALSPCFTTAPIELEAAYERVDDLLDDDTDAVVCASDTLALGVCKRLADLGRTDIQVAGVGNNPMLRFMFPESTTVELGFRDAGKKAADQLISSISNPSATEVSHQVQDCRLIAAK
ncbi:trehalose operon repressor TreR [Parasalinivibrio latis]|uniref:trehalose operon repressor TreR n=1 Tax=Parasalinivibrio latis TaxID=2952610 RepID=UPI0030DE698C